MAGVVLTPATATATATAERSSSSSSTTDRWDVEFSRFFNYPQLSSTSGFSTLHPLPKGKIRDSGTWIVAESPAVISILRSAAALAPVVSVSVSGYIVEEHFVSNLHFSWPQVSCVPQCPVRGSRAVFLSYMDGSCKIQKFAVRFLTCCAAESFIHSAKKCLHNIADTTPVGCSIVCENASPPEVTDTNGRHYRFDEESSYEVPVVHEPIATRAAEMPALTYDDERPDCGLPRLLAANNIDDIFSGFPPSFSELLANCLAETEKEKQAAGGNKSLTEGQSLDPPVGGDAPPDFKDGGDLKSQIVKYMTDPSFHDMMDKIETYIEEMGGGLSL